MDKSSKIKAKILWYNFQKEMGEAQSAKGQKILIFKNSFTSDNEIRQLNEGTQIECQIFNSRQDGIYAYEATVLK